MNIANFKVNECINLGENNKKMMENYKKIFVEVGSTVVKADIYDGNTLKKLDGRTIEFKKNYAINNALDEKDVKELIEYVLSLKEICENIFVCGTSIFRTLDEESKNKFLDNFKKSTNLDFHIISQEEEGMLTVIGATRFVKDKACVFIGGGGSTEIIIYENGIVETANSQIGVVEVMSKFPDLADDFATTDIETVKEYIKERINIPKTKADILILAGGAHEKFARLSGVIYENNSIYTDDNAPIMMDIETRKKESRRYFESISLDKIRSNVKDPKWWYATRAMCAFVLVVAEAIQAKYIIPTDIAMIFGLIDKN